MLFVWYAIVEQYVAVTSLKTRMNIISEKETIIVTYNLLGGVPDPPIKIPFAVQILSKVPTLSRAPDLIG